MGDGKGFDREELAAAVRRKALGYETSESVDEYGLIDGQLALIKRRVTVKDVPPDVAAVKFLMEMYGEDTEELSERQLKEEKIRLIKLLKEEENAVGETENGSKVRNGRLQKTGGIHDQDGQSGD